MSRYLMNNDDGISIPFFDTLMPNDIMKQGYNVVDIGNKWHAIDRGHLMT